MSTAIDEARLEEFVGKVIGDFSGFTATLLAAIGERLGLWKDLAANGPATSAELASRAGINERYAREWLGGMAAAGYLQYDPGSGEFTMPAEHGPVFAQEGGPVFFGGAYQMMTAATLPVFEDVVEAFRSGGGVPQSSYPDDMWDGLERFTAGWFENHLVQEWLPLLPDVQAALERGADVADIGCGRGRALIKLAQEFPESRYVGYDAFEPTVAEAQARAEAAGVGDRVTFEHLDVAKGIPAQYDVVFTFDVIHDAADPAGIVREIRSSLRPGGSYVCLDINCSDRAEENVGPLSTFFFGASVFYCMTTSLAQGGEGLGTLGLPPSKLEALCSDAGFQSVRTVPLENPFNNLYEAKV